MSKLRSHQKVLISLIFLVIFFSASLVFYLKSLEIPSKISPLLIVTLENGCGISCLTSKKVEVYDDSTYKIFTGIEEQNSTEKPGTISNGVFSQLTEAIHSAPKTDNVETDNIDGADMITSTINIFEQSGDVKEYTFNELSLEKHNEHIRLIYQILNSLN